MCSEERYVRRRDVCGGEVCSEERCVRRRDVLNVRRSEGHVRGAFSATTELCCGQDDGQDWFWSDTSLESSAFISGVIKLSERPQCDCHP